MSRVYANSQIAHLDATAIRWLVVAQIAVVLPHVAALPVWLLAMAGLLTAWRFSSFHGYGRMPGPWLRGSVVVVSVLLFFLTFRIQFTVESAVSFFAMAYALKVLEIRERRDLYLFIFLSFFLLAMTFLFDQSLWLSLYVLIAAGICLIGLSSIANPRTARSRTRTVATIMLQAVPLVLIAYVLFPRLAPFWTVPLKSDKVWTGISDRISPGDIADLAQSSERAFRARFNGQRPSQHELYWRALILDQYEDGEWSRSDGYGWEERKASPTPAVEPSIAIHDYEIIQEPTGKPWGYALANPARVAGDFGMTADGLVRFRQDLLQPVRYRLATVTPAAPKELTPLEISRYTALPATGNPATRAWATQLAERAPSTAALADAVMRYFRENPFFYTLKPPLLEEDPVDQFLFQTQRGFCAHYASAFTFAMRAAGVPARMIVGYQGGEWNQDGDYLIVHQFDAHAWVELWLPGQGWVAFDPTAMVVPERISAGIREALAQEGSFLENEPLAFSRYGGTGVLQWLRLRADQVNYNWQRWVVQYDDETQLAFFQRWYRDVSLATLGIWLAVVFAALVLVLLVWLLWAERQRPHDATAKLLLKFEKRLARQGVQRQRGETPRRLAERAARQFPASADAIRRVGLHLERLLYGLDGAQVKEADAAQLKRARVLVSREIRELRLNAGKGQGSRAGG